MSQTAATSQSLCCEEGGEHLVAAIAQADEAEADAIVGAEHAAGAQGGGHGGGSADRGLIEASACHFAHITPSKSVQGDDGITCGDDNLGKGAPCGFRLGCVGQINGCCPLLSPGMSSCALFRSHSSASWPP